MSSKILSTHLPKLEDDMLRALKLITQASKDVIFGCEQSFIWTGRLTRYRRVVLQIVFLSINVSLSDLRDLYKFHGEEWKTCPV